MFKICILEYTDMMKYSITKFYKTVSIYNEVLYKIRAVSKKPDTDSGIPLFT